MGSLKALQDWCRIVCENYPNVNIRNMSTSFRDGLAFCAIIHKHRPDLIDFYSLSKDNIYENNLLAFEVAASKLGIPALLDPRDMVATEVPDRLSIITYLSQYYLVFNRLPHTTSAGLASLKVSYVEVADLSHLTERKPAFVKDLGPATSRIEEQASAGHQSSRGSPAEGQARGTPAEGQARGSPAEIQARGSPAGGQASTGHQSSQGSPAGGQASTGHQSSQGSPAGGQASTGHQSSQGSPSGGQASAGHQSSRGNRATGNPSAGHQSSIDRLAGACVSCRKQVHLVQRQLIEGKLYHRGCFRCRVCSSTLLPGSYRDGEEPGSLVCTHNCTANQRARPDLSRQVVVGSVISDRGQQDTSLKNPPRPHFQQVATDAGLPTHSGAPSPGRDSRSEEVRPESIDSSPPPGGHPGPQGGSSRPVPAPRRMLDPSLPPRPAPRTRALKPSAAGSSADHSRSPPSPGSTSGGHKPKDHPWMSICNPGPWTRLPPAPAPTRTQPSRSSSLSPLHGTGEWFWKKPPPSNPFGEDEDEEDEIGDEGITIGAARQAKPSMATSQSWCGTRLLSKANEASDSARSSPASDEDTRGPAGQRSSSGRADDKFESAEPAPVPEDTGPKRPIRDPGEADCSDSNCKTNRGGTTSTSTAATSSFIEIPKTHGLPELAGAGHSAGAVGSFEAASSHQVIAGEPGGLPGTDCSLGVSCLAGAASGLPGVSDKVEVSAREPGALEVAEVPDLDGEAGSQEVPDFSVAGDLPFPKSMSVPAITSARLSLSPTALPSNGGEAVPSETANTIDAASTLPHSKACRENTFDTKTPPLGIPKSKTFQGTTATRATAPGHGFPLIKRKVQADHVLPVQELQGEMGELEKQMFRLEMRGVELEKRLRGCQNDQEEADMLVDWFTLIHEKHRLVRRDAELVYLTKQRNLEERQADVEYELRCLLNKPEIEWSKDDRGREQQLMDELVTVIDQRNQIINSLEQDRQREKEEDTLLEAMIKKKDFQKEGEKDKKKKSKVTFKPLKVLMMLGHKTENTKDSKNKNFQKKS